MYRPGPSTPCGPSSACTIVVNSTRTPRSSPALAAKRAFRSSPASNTREKSSVSPTPSFLATTTHPHPTSSAVLIAHAKSLGVTQAGLVVTDTPSFEDGHEAIVAQSAEAGIEIVVDARISKTAAVPEQLATTQEIKDAGYEMPSVNQIEASSLINSHTSGIRILKNAPVTSFLPTAANCGLLSQTLDCRPGIQPAHTRTYGPSYFHQDR